MIWPFKRRAPAHERRASGSGFTAEIMAARESYIAGRRGIGELTATAQACVSLWEGGLSIAQVDGAPMLTPRTLALIARALALRGDTLFLIDGDRLLAASDWDVATRDGEPVAYRLSISEAGGGRTMTALAGEVLHIRIGADPVAPWIGQAPLRRAALTAGLLHALESALGEIFENAPLGSQIVPFPESPETDNNALSRGFRGRRGAVLLRESVMVTAAGGPAPAADWRPNSLTPDISVTEAAAHLAAARASICNVFGVLPALMNATTTGPVVREAQRHLAAWVLQPICELIAEEARDKLGVDVDLDVISPLQAFDQGGRARAFTTLINGLAAAKEAGLSPAEVAGALRFIDERTPAD